MTGEVEHLVGEAPLVVVPGDELDEVIVQRDAGLGVEDGGVRIGAEVGGDDVLVDILQNTLHRAFISTICCCWPLGVVGIVFAYQTKKKYREGNYLKAEKFSEYGAWAIIASIILGLISTPLACSHYLLQGLG